MAEEKKYYWLKLHDDFFTSKRVKRLRALAGGDTYTIIYLKMQLKALKTNGFLYFDNIMEDFAEELALDIDENVENVKIVIQYLMSVGLMEASEDGHEYCMTFMQNLIGSEGSSTQRVREFRARKKQQEALQCNTAETDVKQNRYGEIEIEKEIDKDIYPYGYIVDYLNSKTGKNFKASSNKTKTCIRARFKEGFTKEDFITVIDKKVRSWKGNPKMEPYLRPETLFGTKFEGYLNEGGGNNGAEEGSLYETYGCPDGLDCNL